MAHSSELLTDSAAEAIRVHVLELAEGSSVAQSILIFSPTYGINDEEQEVEYYSLAEIDSSVKLKMNLALLLEINNFIVYYDPKIFDLKRNILDYKDRKIQIQKRM